MRTLISKRIIPAVLFVFIWGLTACCHTPTGGLACPQNVKAGLATITCQPLDAEVTNHQPAVDFAVDASGNKIAYQWFRAGTADQADVPLGEDREGKIKYRGADSPRLTILEPAETDSGFYYCQMQTIDLFGLPILTRTRSASLGTTVPYIHIESLSILTVVQPLPLPGSTGQACNCGIAQACSEVPFRNENSGYKFTNGVYYISLALSNPQGTAQTSIDPSTYQVVVADGDMTSNTFTAGCAMRTNTPSQWCFKAVSNHLYQFAIYFNCTKPPRPTAAYPNVQLTVSR